MYEALRFLHALSAMAYFLFHGVVASVTFAFRRDPGPVRVQVLSDAMSFAYRGAPIAGVILVLSGILLGVLGRFWGERWLWASVGLLLVLGILMNRLGKPYMTEAFDGARNPGSGTRLQPRGRIAAGLRKFAFHPMFFTVTGLIGLAIVLWLMMFKPA
jgi:hypothetical protein